MAEKAVVVQDLVKAYPRVMAVNGISFTVPEKEIFGLLGPNGAGKTTTIRMLLTLIKPTSGTIHIFGVNAAAEPEKTREMAGYVPQDVSVDGELTGYENILMYARLYHVPRREREARIKQVLSYLGLQDRMNDMVSTYSGGMMRRIELAQTLVNRPRILYLDEPSIGLDPSAKRMIWDLVKKLREEFSTTIFLTTHDMNEADILCDRIGIIDRGRLILEGAPAQLRASMGGDVLTLGTKAPGCQLTLEELGYKVLARPADCAFEILVANGEQVIPRLLETLKTKGIEVETVSLKKPTLDDVFLKYTGARIEEGEGWSQARRTRRTFRRLTK